MPLPDLEILLPVHNEAGSIEAIIRGIDAELSARLFDRRKGYSQTETRA